MELVRTLAGMLLVATLMCSGNLCINMSKQDDKILYSSTSVTLLIEVLKSVVMLSVVVITKTPPPARFVSIEVFYYAVPSFLYSIDNNLNYVILRYMDAATLSVLWNLKIVVTAILFRFVLKQPLSELRIAAIVLLVIGVLTSQANHLRQMEEALVMKSSSGSGMETQDAVVDKSTHDLAVGVLLVLIGVMLSSCASVFTEWTFKRKSSCSFLWQNMQMYVFGTIFNAIGVTLIDGKEISRHGFFHDYNKWTLAVVAVSTIGGIGMGLILKYLDNIACVYSHSMAMMLTMLFSMLFFSFHPTLEFGCGFIVLIVSMYIYHHPQARADVSPSATSSGRGFRKHEISAGVENKDHNKTKRHTELRQQEDDDTNTSSITLRSDNSSSIESRPMHGLQLKRMQYSMLPGESEDLESARANAKAMI